jgi:16S rRNA (guanine(966)-N(2))-methyltransferase RsmD
MISLIAGKYKGKKLYQFSNKYVRPTQAKVRKSVFQILEPFDGLEVLDLYAGVGTFGFEALSRGADRAVFVEKEHRVYKILEKNSALFQNEKMRLHLHDSIQFLSQTYCEQFDIIFADPPYRIKSFKPLIEKALNCLKPKGIFCMEMKKQDVNESPYRVKHYGNTQVVFWKAVA